MSHSHDDVSIPQGGITRRQQRVLNIIMAAIFVIACVEMIRLWPREAIPKSSALGQGNVVHAVVQNDSEPCAFNEQQSGVSSTCVSIKITSGSDKGSTADMVQPAESGSLHLHKGDKILVNVENSAGESFYSFYDFQRSNAMWLLIGLFLVALIAFGRMQGIRALIGLGISFLVIIFFYLPAFLLGNNIVEIALVGAVFVLFTNLYLAHGFSFRTTVAVLGTLLSLIIILLLSVVFISLTHLTGLASDEATTLAALQKSIDIRGLLIGGFVIGALGVLDDVTVTQVSSVWEVARHADVGARQLFRSGMQVGRDHIASTVNTLVFAYAGASIPLLLILIESKQSVGLALGSEVLAVEIVRALVGSIGLISAVPITTALAAYAAHGNRNREVAGNTHGEEH